MEIINQKLVLALHYHNGDLLDRAEYESTAEGFVDALENYDDACSRAGLGEEVSLYLEDGDDETAILRHYIN